MKRDNKPTTKKENLRIDKICEEGLYQKFNPQVFYHLSEFVNRNFRHEMLKDLLGRDVQLIEISDDAIAWYKTGQYASGLKFMIQDTSPLRYDENGFLCNPLRLDLSPEAEADLLRECDSTNLVHVSCGKLVPAKDDEKRDTFYIETLPLGSLNHMDILLAMKWGGPNNITYGATEETSPWGECYCKKIISNGGSEGVDYFIIPFNELLEPLQKAITHALDRQTKSEDDFGKKWQHFLEYCDRYKAVCDEHQKVLDEAATLALRCEQNPLAQLVFVEPPKDVELYEFDDEFNDKFGLTPDIDLMIISQTVIQAEKRLQEEKGCLVQKRIEVSLWEDLAPKFARLYSTLAHKYYGWIKINGCLATVTLPTIDNTNTEPYTSIDYPLSEVSLDDLFVALDKYDLFISRSKQKTIGRLDCLPTIEELLKRQETELFDRLATNEEDAKNSSASLEADQNDGSCAGSDRQ